MARPEALLLIGPTAVGKTPLGDHLARDGLAGQRCVHCDFGARFRDAVAGRQTDPALAAEDVAVLVDVLSRGRLLTDDEFRIAAAILAGCLRTRDYRPGDLVVLNGVPRRLGQARDIAALADVRTIVHLRATPAVVAERIRRDPGGDRAGRSDDDSGAVRRRLEIFARETLPLVSHYRAAGARVLEFDVGVDTRPEDLCLDPEP